MFKVFLPLLLLSIVFTACSSKLIRARESHPNSELLSSNEAELVLYRTNGDKNYVPMIMVDNRVVGSLLPNRFAQTRVRKGMVSVGLVDDLKEEKVVHYNPPMAINGSSNVYLRVNEIGNGHFSLTQVDDKIAKNDLSEFNAESHIINRYVSDCTPPAPVPLPAPAPITIIQKSEPIVLQRINLSADALFSFGKSHLEDMLPKGRAKLDALAKEIQLSTVNIEKLTISGHTDRLTQSKSFDNGELSYKRAKTVADYLQSKGIQFPMEAIGKGSSEPVTTWCKGPRSAKLIECLQPDRRVSVDLIGQKTIAK